MAGTSGDGIDLVCARIAGVGKDMNARLLWHRHRRFPAQLRRRLLAAMAPANTTTEEIARLHAALGEAFGRAARQAIETAPRHHRPSVIGLAGQTICHLPGGAGRTTTLQLGEPARVAVATGLPVIAEFRQSDVAAGGQGAPLVPWTDWILLRNARISRAIQNIGGIGNVTWLAAGGGTDDVIAFDTGPGNMIIDTLVSHVSRGREPMDRNGRRAARGQVLSHILSRWLKHPFLKRRPPKSTGRETFGRIFVEKELPRLRSASRCPDDWIATATEFTAQSIAQAYRRFLPDLFGRIAKSRRGISTRSGSADPVIELVVCGGGASNPTLVARLGAALPELNVIPIDSLGIPAQAKEAMSFAVLAAACMDGTPANLPQVTGARRHAVLGQIVRP